MCAGSGGKAGGVWLGLLGGGPGRLSQARTGMLGGCLVGWLRVDGRGLEVGECPAAAVTVPSPTWHGAVSCSYGLGESRWPGGRSGCVTVAGGPGMVRRAAGGSAVGEWCWGGWAGAGGPGYWNGESWGGGGVAWLGLKWRRGAGPGMNGQFFFVG